MKDQANVYRLLALCACVKGSAAQRHLLAQAAQATDWTQLPPLAEAHGLAPLTHIHLQAAGVPLPLAVKRQLQGLYLRHRHANTVRLRILRNIVAAYSAANIQALLLKGAALSYLVYPEPALRPMSDLDILVAQADLPRAQTVLAELGFALPSPPQRALLHRHLTAATLHAEGVAVHVELHHRLSSNYFDNASAYVQSLIPPIFNFQTKPDEMAAMPYSLTLDGLTAWTLSLEDTLGYLSQHLVSHVNIWDFGRLIWVADIVSLAERFVDEINWNEVLRQYPFVSNTLSLIHFMTPLSDQLLNRASVRIGHPPQGIGVEYQGWLRAPSIAWGKKGYRRLLRDTLFPSEWWLRLRYQLGTTRPLAWHRWVRHPLYILGQVGRVCLERLGWPRPQELAGTMPGSNQP